MKIGFSTLSCPDWSWTDIYSMAKDFKFDGIEIRGLGNEIFSVKAQPLQSYSRWDLKFLVYHQVPALNSRTSIRKLRTR